MKNETAALCFRCEHRARFLENGWRPRFECGNVTGAVLSCYMYRPAMPVWTSASDPKDPRPRLGPSMIAARERATRVADKDEVQYGAVIRGHEVLLYCAGKKGWPDYWRHSRYWLGAPVRGVVRLWWRAWYTVTGPFRKEEW